MLFHRLGAGLLRAVLRIRAVRPDRRRRATFRWPGAGSTRAAVRAGRRALTTTTSPTRLSPPPPCAGRRSGQHGAAASSQVPAGTTVTSAVVRRPLERPARRCCLESEGDLTLPPARCRAPAGRPPHQGCAPCSSEARHLPLARRWAYAGSCPAGRCAPTTTTSPTRLSPPPPCAGRRSGRPGAAASRPGAIVHFHRLGAVLLRAILRIRAVRPDRRRRALFRRPGAGPTRAAVRAGRRALTTTTSPTRLSPPAAVRRPPERPARRCCFEPRGDLAPPPALRRAPAGRPPLQGCAP